MYKMKWYDVTCVDATENAYAVNVMASDELAAKHCAEYSLREGKHVNAKATSAAETRRT